ncbi:MAG TPA: M64 family metallopeptidase, partial [Kofleriaceae bacterium]|nr:M64 family metallopeptidase [Kofleriaceae bacterium]
MLTWTARWLLVAMTATAACSGGDRESDEGPGSAGREVALDVLVDDARGVQVVAIYPVAELPPLVGVGEPSLRWQLEVDGDPIASGTFADPRLLRSEGGPALRSRFGIAALRVPERAGELVILERDVELGRAAFDPGIGVTRSALLRAGDVRGGPVRILGDRDRASAVDVLVLPEGYTAAQLGRFRRDALQIGRAFRGVVSSQRRLGGRINIWVQDVRSRSSGIDDPAAHRIADTAFDVGFGDGGGRRCTFFHTPDGLATARQLGRMAGAEVVIVLAHTAEHGGCAGPGVVVMTHGRWAPWTMAHELGHALVGL